MRFLSDRIILTFLLLFSINFIVAQCVMGDLDSDNDGVCDLEDVCPNQDDALIGTPCDDGNICTENDVWTTDCECRGTKLPDADFDGVCNNEDVCPDFDDNIDIDKDGIPYCMDDCVDVNENGICDGDDPEPFTKKLKIYLSHKRGFYDNTFQLKLYSNNPNAIIKYTTSTSIPSVNSGNVYSSPISVTIPTNGVFVVKVMAYTSTEETVVQTHSYIFLDQVYIHNNVFSNTNNDPVLGPKLRQGFLDLPSVSIFVDNNQAINGSTDRKVSIEWLFPNSLSKEDENHQIDGGIRYATGGANGAAPKRSLKLYFRAEHGYSKLEYPLFKKFEHGIKATEKFDRIYLRNGSHDSTIPGPYNGAKSGVYVKQRFSQDCQLAMGNIAPHGRFVQVFLNGAYYGMFHMGERPTRGFMEEYFGGDGDQYDAIKAGVASSGTVAQYNEMVGNSNNYEAIQDYMNVQSFIDYLLLMFHSASHDYFTNKNWRAAGPSEINTPEGAKWHFFGWDMDTGLYWSSGQYGSHPNSNTAIGVSPGNMYAGLKNDLEFKFDFADRMQCNFYDDGVMAKENMTERFQKRINEIENAVIAEHLRWTNVNTYNNNWKANVTRAFTFIEDREDYLLPRMEALDMYPILSAVEFSKNGGTLTANEALSLINNNNSGEIYFTTNGEDPRLAGGELNPNATLYSGEIVFPVGVYEIFARIYDPSQNKHIDKWSAACPKVFYVDQNYSDLVINEIHYNPKDSIFFNPELNTMDTIDGKNFEFIELKNIGLNPINLYGARFSKGVDLLIDSSIVVPPNGFVVFAEDAEWFEAKYGFAPAGEFSGQLDNDGEKINMKNHNGYFIDTVRYDNKNPWDEAPNEDDFTLELLHSSLNNGNPLNWFRSDFPGGTPGYENSRTCVQAVSNIVINEINYNSNNDLLDPGNWVELHNPNANAVDLSGWTFYDNGGAFILPPGTSIPAEGFILLVDDEDDFTTAFPDVHPNKIIGEFPFGLSKKGERISLFDQNKCLVDYVIYNDKDPWPETPDGDGPTLSLLEPSLDNALPESWESSFQMNESFAYGSPGVSNICVPGQPCNDGDPCTSDDTFDADCNCVGTLMPQDDDNDGVCNLADICPNFDDLLIGTPCDDGNICTEGEIYDENCGCSGGIINDLDNDGICDPLDDCDNNLEGAPCDDGDICTAGETYDADCNCTGGVFQDIDNDGICDAEDICPNLENNLLGQLCDDGDPLTEFDTYNANTCSCSGIIASAEICVNISSSEDDAEEQVDNGVVTLTSGDLDMVNDEGVIFLAGMRFQNIDIPQGATITNATIQFAADEINTDPTNLTIKAEAIDHATVFEATANNISNRTLTDASIIWQPDPWNAIGDNAAAQKTVDISPIIQEIIDRPGFAAGNAIALIINGTGIRTAESFDGDQNLPPQLCITYSTGLCVENYPCDDNDPTTINDVYDENCNCVGESIRLNAKAMLEGFYDQQNNNMHKDLNDKNLVPLNQPFNIAPWNYGGDESVSSIPENAVDWILLITRDSDGNVLDQAAGFINQNGALMHLDGSLGIPISQGVGNNFSIHHRSHLAILSSSSFDGQVYDFTTAANQAAGNDQLKLIDGKFMMHSGDYDGNGIINSIDFNNWKTQGAIINQYLPIDGDGNGIINSLDFNLWTNNKSKIGHPIIRY